MNSTWALAELDKFVQATALIHQPSPAGVISGGTYVTAQLDTEIAKQAQVVEQILDRTTPAWRDLGVSMRRNRWQLHREAALRCREAIDREEEIRSNLGESAPALSAAELHPWVWSGASSLWQSKHFREAVEGALKKVNAETQNKVGRRDVSETDLFKQAFSLDRPAIGKPRLRRMASDGSKTYDSVQRGAMNLAEGIFVGIRNPLSHEAVQELGEQQALEYLAALSVLARWVDEASIEVAEGPA
jgi:uncharacterized protein (TIGR02391 family)